MSTLAALAIDSLPAWAFHLLAQAATTATPATGPGAKPPGWFEFLSSFGPIILLVIVFIWFSSSAKRRQERERATLLNSLSKGDKVKLIGGEYGSIVETRDGRVLVKVDESSNTKIWYAREAIASVEKDAAPAKDKVAGGQ